jgi:hypothetical protein
MVEPWEETSTPRERIETIVQTQHRPATVSEIAEWAHVDTGFAENVVAELLAEGMLERHADDRYALSPDWALAFEIRDLGEETEDGILVPYDVLEDMESRPKQSEE